MFIVSKNETVAPVQFNLIGVIDESVDFATLFPMQKAEIALNCKGVTRINSVGIKLWRDFFQKFRAFGGSIRFHEISPCLVTTMNYISDFVDKNELVSFGAPYVCPKCKDSPTVVMNPDVARQSLPEAPSITCALCSSKMELDEIPAEYFAFLTL
jgi:anti-anti-sigma regulatory factor